MVTPLGEGFELAANVGTGLRFPTLSERTLLLGRRPAVAGVQGNPDLDSERSLSFDLGLRWYGEKPVRHRRTVFRNEIDDYIERIEIEDDRLTFVNLLEGTIRGVEFDGVVPALRVVLEPRVRRAL